MKISYPIRNTSDKEFRSLDDVMRLIDDEAHGTWLLGANRLWHGGIHISDISNPFSALNQMHSILGSLYHSSLWQTVLWLRTD
jgi:hypothetical protein